MLERSKYAELLSPVVKFFYTYFYKTYTIGNNNLFSITFIKTLKPKYKYVVFHDYDVCFQV